MSLETVREFFARNAPDVKIIELDGSTATVALAAQGHGVCPGQIAKTLSLKVQDCNFLVVTRGDARLDNTVRRINADHAGAPDKIEIAADGRSAVGYFDCAVEAETQLAKDCTLAQMAHVQGSGAFLRSERRLLTVEFTKTGGTWKIANVALTTL